jgi:hypothetical protein
MHGSKPPQVQPDPVSGPYGITVMNMLPHNAISADAFLGE